MRMILNIYDILNKIFIFSSCEFLQIDNVQWLDSSTLYSSSAILIIIMFDNDNIKIRYLGL